MIDYSHTAIQSALAHDWEKAISINLSIIQEKEDDIEALSRLAYAYTQIGKIDEAKKTYKKILSIDKYNFIAQKNLDKINALPKNSKFIAAAGKTSHLSPTLFLEEPGKTKSIVLINVAPVSILSKMTIGEMVYLNAKKHSIEVRDEKKVYLGALPDDIAFRLIRFIESGNTYNVYVKNVQKNSISIFIREDKRGKKFQHQPSFQPMNFDFSPSAPKELKRKWTEEEEETPEGETKEPQDEFEE